MKTIVNGLTVTIDEVDGAFVASASFAGENIIQLSATSSRDYAAVAALFDAIKHQAIENLKEMSDTPLVGNRRMGHAGEPQEATYEVR